jgi:hypothetical protein
MDATLNSAPLLVLILEGRGSSALAQFRRDSWRHVTNHETPEGCCALRFLPLNEEFELGFCYARLASALSRARLRSTPQR